MAGKTNAGRVSGFYMNGTGLGLTMRAHDRFDDAQRIPIGQYTNGNATVTIYSDGTKTRHFDGDEFRPSFAENIDIKLTNRCIGTNCAFCHEGSGPNGDTISKIPGFIFTLHPYQEVALGGGNLLNMEDSVLGSILWFLKSGDVIANATFNQVHFEENASAIFEYVGNDLLHGVGISLVAPTNKLIYNARRLPNSVIHVIAGIVTKDEIKALSGCGLRLLVLGYKKLRRGDAYYELNKEKIDSRIKDLSECILDMSSGFDVVSFDNLAIEQLGIKGKVTEEQWERRYMGDDGTSTFYIDCVNKRFARSSTAPIESRMDGTKANGVRAYAEARPFAPFMPGPEYSVLSKDAADLDWKPVDEMFGEMRAHAD